MIVLVKIFPAWGISVVIWGYFQLFAVYSRTIWILNLYPVMIIGVDTVRSLHQSMKSLEAALRRQNLFWSERSVLHRGSISIISIFVGLYTLSLTFLFIYLFLMDFYCWYLIWKFLIILFRSTVMSTRAYVANMGSLGTRQFNGFLRDHLNRKSKEKLFDKW